MADNDYGIGMQKYPGQRTYVMYHGTTMINAQKIQREGFIPSSDGMLGPGVYVSRSKEKASRYPLNAGGQQLAILKLSVRVGKVKKIDRQGHRYRQPGINKVMTLRGSLQTVEWYRVD